MRLIVVRHGETEWNAQKRTQGTTDTKLTAHGEQQAKLLSHRILKMQVDKIVSSPLQRALETAKIIAQTNHQPITIDHDLIEIRFGEWEGLTFDEIGELYPHEFSVWSKTPHLSMIPQAESVSEVIFRVDSFLARMQLNYKDETVAAVTHSLPSKLIVARSIGLSIGNIHSLRIDNASLTVIDFYSDRQVLRLMNDTVHLQEGVAWQL